MSGHLAELNRKPQQSVAKGGLDLGKHEDAAEKEEAEKAADEYKDLLDKVKKTLGDKVKDVRVTHRLTDSPSCIVADEYDIGGNLQRILKAAGQQAPANKPILEINPKHPAVQRLKYEETRFDDWANLLLEQATLAEGGSLDDPAGFVKRINDLMLALSLGSSR